MFERIEGLLKPQAPTDKYAGTYFGKTKLATIAEGQQLQGIFLANTAKYRKAPGQIVAVSLLAKNAISGQESYVKVEDMLNDRFPADKPIDLYLEVEQGGKRNTSDDQAGEDMIPAATTGQIMLNVYATIVELVEDEKVALQRLFAEVDRAAGVAAAGGIAKVVERDIAANKLANEAREPFSPTNPDTFAMPPAHEHQE